MLSTMMFLHRCQRNIKKKMMMMYRLRSYVSTAELHEFPLKNLPRGSVYVSTSSDPFTNLAFEEFLFREAQFQHTHGVDGVDGSAGIGQRILFLYRNNPCVVIGRNQNPWIECNIDLMLKDGVTLVRRRSGGGAVYHDAGNLNCSLLTSRSAYTKDTLTAFLVDALNTRWPDLCLAVNERNDIVSSAAAWSKESRKVSGSAYRLGARNAYHHCTLLHSADTFRLSNYLHGSRTMPITSHGTTSVRSSVSNLSVADASVSGSSLCNVIADGFLNAFGLPGVHLPTHHICPAFIESQFLLDCSSELQSWEWIYGQTPKFSLWLRPHLSWARMEIRIETNRGIVSTLKMSSGDPGIPAEDAALLDRICTMLSPFFIGQRFSQDLLVNAASKSLHELNELYDDDDDSRYYVKIQEVLEWMIHEPLKT